MWNRLENKTVLLRMSEKSLNRFKTGEVDAGIVYMTDAKAVEPYTIKIVTNIPVSTPINYTIAVVSSSESKENVQKFVDLVTGEEGQKVLKKYGFKISERTTVKPMPVCT